MNLGKILSIVALATAPACAFEITSTFPEKGTTKLQEGQNLQLWCNVDDHWEWCKFTHVPTGKTCDLQWMYNGQNVTTIDCHRDFEYLGDYDNYKCGIGLKNVDLAMNGEWKCDVEEFYRAETIRNYGTVVSKTFQVDVEANNGFSIVSNTPSSGSLEIEEGDPIDLWCNMDEFWEWCTFKHMTSNKLCDFQWMTALDNVTVTECDFEGRYEYLGDYDDHKCGIRIKQATPGDSGEWRCDLEEYSRAETKRGYGKEAGMSFRVTVT